MHERREDESATRKRSQDRSHRPALLLQRRRHPELFRGRELREQHPIVGIVQHIRGRHLAPSEDCDHE